MFKCFFFQKSECFIQFYDIRRSQEGKSPICTFVSRLNSSTINYSRLNKRPNRVFCVTKQPKFATIMHHIPTNHTQPHLEKRSISIPPLNSFIEFGAICQAHAQSTSCDSVPTQSETNVYQHLHSAHDDLKWMRQSWSSSRIGHSL